MQGSLGSTSSKEDVADGLENYDILKQIRRGSRSAVHLALCKKGRLRNRKVAIKEITVTTNDPAAPYSIHQALHHPSILSCFSTFSTSSACYHVLEYCAHGSLSEVLASRDPPVLKESELRGVLRNLVDALVCLEKNRIVHGDISPKTIFVTADYRVKLGNFSTSILLPPGSSAAAEKLCKNSNRISTEATSYTPFSFFSDLCSIGCLILTCLGREAPSQSGGLRTGFANSKYQPLDIPGDASSELKDLISDLLHTVPERNIALHNILAHPFFHPALPIHSLDPTRNSKTPQPLINSKRSENHQDLSNSGLSWSRQALTKDLIQNQKLFLDSRTILGNASNLSQRLRLVDQSSRRQPLDVTQLPARRVVSDPATGTNTRRKFLDGEPMRVRFRSRSVAATPSFLGRLAKDTPMVDKRVVLVHEDVDVLLSEFEDALQSPPGCPISSTPKRDQELSPLTFTGEELVAHPGYTYAKEDHIFMQVPGREEKRAAQPVAIGVTRPEKLDTLLLLPQTHKVNRGQLTVLPSHSLLVDFREGERRQGRVGSEVLLVDPDGIVVKVYSAPYLSSPCCLAEPDAVYSLEDLPSVYWKQYNDAGHIVEQIKQHIPKLIMYDVDFKCTLMANGPDADIELLFYNFAHQTSPQAKKDQAKLECRDAIMRIRLMRKRQLLEISRHVGQPNRSKVTVGGDAQGGEWRKKIIVIPGGDLSVVERGTLEAEEVRGLTRAIAFTSICDSIERRALLSRSRDTESSSSPTPTTIIDSSWAPNETSVEPTSESSNALSHLEVPPRLPRFSSLEREVKQHSQSLSADYEGFDTRFIPSVGWCVRYGSSGGAGRYKMMFFDGAILEVDVDGECVEFVNSVTEEVVRYDIRDCSSKRNVMDRMKAFKEFVSLFDDSNDST